MKPSMAYLGRSHPWGCHLQFWYLRSLLPNFSQADWSDMNLHPLSEYKGYVVLSYTHWPENKSQVPAVDSLASMARISAWSPFLIVMKMVRTMMSAMDMVKMELKRFLRPHSLRVNWLLVAISTFRPSSLGSITTFFFCKWGFKLVFVAFRFMIQNHACLCERVWALEGGVYNPEPSCWNGSSAVGQPT